MHTLRSSKCPRLCRSRAAWRRCWRSTTIGVHYTNSNYGGSSISIVGTTCSGGTWPATGSWNNNIESSEHLCGSAYTTFYDYGSCATSSNYRILSRQPSLYGLNNKTSCVRYG